MVKHAAIYARVSSKSQDTKSQEPELERWIKGQSEPVKWYRDKFTGKSMDRPAWNKLKNAIDKGEISTIVIWRLDRLGRTAKGLTALFEELIQRKINIISMREGIDLSTPSGRMIANVLASMAQFETEVRAERVLAGQAVARANGVKWGGRKAGTKVRVTPEKERTILQMKKNNESISDIARVTELSRPTIYSVLKG